MPKQNKDYDIEQSMRKIQKIIDFIQKNNNNVTYNNLINFLLYSEKNNFIAKEKKIEYLINFFLIKLKKTSEISDTSINKKEILKTKINKIINNVYIIKNQNDDEKYNKSLKIYKNKANSKIIFDYLDFIY